MMDEGYIKFNLDWEKAPPIDPIMIEPLIEWRNELYKQGWIGQYEELGIGYGNISERWAGSSQFVISGTQTGHLSELDESHFTLVDDYDFGRNWVHCRGPLKASSESLTHAMIYRMDPDIGAVLHIHHKEKWAELLNEVPTTRAEVPYGTPEMAAEIARLWQESDLREAGFLAMAGHEEGLIAFGEDLDMAGEILRHFMA